VTRRRRSSVTEMRYEIYNRMLKSLPGMLFCFEFSLIGFDFEDAVIVREKMIGDGFSENEIQDFFGIDIAMTLGGTGRQSGKGMNFIPIMLHIILFNQEHR